MTGALITSAKDAKIQTYVLDHTVIVNIYPSVIKSRKSVEEVLRRPSLKGRFDLDFVLKKHERCRTAELSGISFAAFGVNSFFEQPLLRFRDGLISFTDNNQFFPFNLGDAILVGANRYKGGVWAAYLPEQNLGPAPVRDYTHIGNGGMSRLHLYVEKTGPSEMVLANLGHHPVGFQFTRPEKTNFCL